MSSNGVEKLTGRQKEILRLLVAGHDAKSVGLELGISFHTVHEHLREARRLLGVSNSREAARILRQAEFTPPPNVVGHDILGVAGRATSDVRSPRAAWAHPAAFAGVAIMMLIALISTFLWAGSEAGHGGQLLSHSSSLSVPGLQAYPGAVPDPTSDAPGRSRQSLSLDGVSVEDASSATYRVSAQPAQVLGFYRSAMRRLGPVTECAGGRNPKESVRLTPRELINPAACSADDFGESATELKVAASGQIWIVVVRQSGGASDVALVRVRGARADSRRRT